MDIQDILFLVAAVAVWIYSSFRKLQKEAAARAKKIAAAQPAPAVAQVKPVKMAGKSRQENILQTKPPSTQRSSEIYNDNNETKKAETFWKKFQSDETTKASNINIDKKLPVSTSQEIINEIRSGKTDWKRAVILAEIIRPVYFQ